MSPIKGRARPERVACRDHPDIEALAETWRGAGADVDSYEFRRTLGLPHDVVDVAQPKAHPETVYPVLLALLGFGG